MRWNLTAASSAMILCLVLASCGGGGGGGSVAINGGASSGSSSSAPSALTYPTPPTYTKGLAITSLTPTVTGAVISYAVNPALPAGLSVNVTTGVISGTPTVVTPATNYVVTASNAAGKSTTTTVMITVNDVSPNVAYVPYYAFTANVPAQTVAPTSSGGAVTSWSINPALPAGLSFSATDGTITGTPAAAQTPATYSVTASNSGGQTTATFMITIVAAPLLDVGHAVPINVLRFNGTQLLSLDINGHWLLQDFASGHSIASGDGVPCVCEVGTVSAPYALSNNYSLVELDGPTVLIQTTSVTQILSAATGAVSASLPSTYSWYQLASDGSYVSAGGTTGLMVWSPSGQVLVTRQGDYSKALAFASPAQINVAFGPAGASVIESIAISTGASTVGSSFQGTFVTWFTDGSAYLTQSGNAVWIYSSSGTQREAAVFNGTGGAFGVGNWFGLIPVNGPLNLYQVGGSTNPVYSIGADGGVVTSASTVGVFEDDAPVLTVVDLSSGSPVATATTFPIELAYPGAYAASSASNWVVGSEQGVLIDASKRDLTLGQVMDIVAGTNFFSVATASGTILNFDATSDDQVGTISFAASQLSASTSGNVLVAVQSIGAYLPQPSGDINVYSLPAGTAVTQLTGLQALAANVSGSGSALGVASGDCASNYMSYTSCTQIVYALPSGNLVFSAPPVLGGVVPVLSPDGTLVANSNYNSLGPPQTYIYQNGSLVGSVAGGLAAGWLDNSNLLVAQYQHSNQEGQEFPVFVDDAIFGPSGTQTATSPLQLTTFQPLTSGALYSPANNTIVSPSSGAVSWASGDAIITPNGPNGAATGTQVIFASGNLVLAQPHP